MSESNEQYLQQAISTLAQSDPITKLLNEVKLGRMQPTDVGLRAITESWLGTYRQILQKPHALDHGSLLKLDPSPRLDVLTEAGVIPSDHAAVVALRTVYQQALTDAKKHG